jgi:hypothetical protein
VDHVNCTKFTHIWARDILLNPALAEKVAGREKRFANFVQVGLILATFFNEHEGEIVSVSQEGLAMTGFDREDMINARVSELLPTCMQDWHDQAMSQFLTEFVPKSVLHKQDKFLINKKKHITPIIFSATLLPCIEEGIKAASILTPVAEQANVLHLLYEEKSNRVHAFSNYIERYLPESW